MMSPQSILIGFAILVSSLNPAISFDCPDFCTCTVAQDNGALQNHAKCQSLEGLIAVEGKHIPLHSLDLSNANLTRITSHLEKFRDLVMLDLSNNQLSEVGKLGRRIKTLNLSHNKITSGKLGKIPNYVENLDLSENEITYLPLDLKKLHSLKSIELTGNAINCTCETLEIRNWLQEHHVWTDNHIKCTYPLSAKGKPWLHVKQSDICDDHKDEIVLYKEQELASDDENELMLGDQPIESEGSGQGNDDELGKDFLPVDDKKDKKTEDTIDINAEEGSGEIFPINELDKTSDAANGSAITDVVDGIPPEIGSGGNELEDDEQGRLMEDDDEGSGSGMIAYIPKIQLEPEADNKNDDDDIADNEKEENTPVPPPQEEVTKSPDDIFGPGLGIMTSEEVTKAPVVEEPIVEKKVATVDQAKPGDEVDGPVASEAAERVPKTAEKENMVAGESNRLEEANSGASKNTYILLVVVLVLLVVLIVFVAVKRRKANRRRESDVENPRATELVDMNKKNLGKPLNKNGAPEHIPLIGDRDKSDLAKPINGDKKTPYSPSDEKDPKSQEPLLKDGEATTGPESNNNVANDTVSPQVAKPVESQPPAQNVEPVHKPKSPRDPYRKTDGIPPSDDEVFLPASAPTSNPSSPKASRYSPVYSPETGRVKIKLLETPKPKTPLLVNRTRSNAGDVITTPNGNSLRSPDQSH